MTTQLTKHIPETAEGNRAKTHREQKFWKVVIKRLAPKFLGHIILLLIIEELYLILLLGLILVVSVIFGQILNLLWIALFLVVLRSMLDFLLKHADRIH